MTTIDRDPNDLISRKEALAALHRLEDITVGQSLLVVRETIKRIAALPAIPLDESQHRDRLRPLGGNDLIDAVDHLEEIDSTDVRDTEHLEKAISAIKRFLALPVLAEDPSVASYRRAVERIRARLAQSDWIVCAEASRVLNEAIEEPASVPVLETKDDMMNGLEMLDILRGET